jgi:hypothetical protein
VLLHLYEPRGVGVYDLTREPGVQEMSAIVLTGERCAEQ